MLKQDATFGEIHTANKSAHNFYMKAIEHCELIVLPHSIFQQYQGVG